MSQHFNKVVSNSLSLRPLTIAKTANEVARAFGKKRLSKTDEKKMKIKTKEVRQENKGPVRRLKLEQSKGILAEQKIKKDKNLLKIQYINENPKSEIVVREENNLKLYESMKTLKSPMDKKIKAINAKIEKLDHETKNHISKRSQTLSKSNRIHPYQRQKEKPKTKNVMEQQFKFPPIIPTGVIEPPRNQQMKRWSSTLNTATPFVLDSLMPVNTAPFQSLPPLPKPYRSEPQEYDPLLLWKHPTLSNKMNFDMSITMQRIQRDSQKFQIGRQRLVEKHSPWERTSITLSHVDNGDYSSKCAKRYNAISRMGRMLSPIKSEELLEMPRKNKYEFNVPEEPRHSPKDHYQKSNNSGVDTSRSSVASLRTSVNKKIYRHYPNMHRVKPASSRLGHAISLQPNKC